MILFRNCHLLVARDKKTSHRQTDARSSWNLSPRHIYRQSSYCCQQAIGPTLPTQSLFNKPLVVHYHLRLSASVRLGLRRTTTAPAPPVSQHPDALTLPRESHFFHPTSDRLQSVSNFYLCPPFLPSHHRSRHAVCLYFGHPSNVTLSSSYTHRSHLIRSPTRTLTSLRTDLCSRYPDLTTSSFSRTIA